MRGASGDKPAAGRRRRSQRPGFSYQVRLIGGVAARRLEREQAEAIAEALRRLAANRDPATLGAAQAVTQTGSGPVRPADADPSPGQQAVGWPYPPEVRAQSWSTPWTPTTSGARTRTQILDKQVLLCSALPRPRPAPDVPLPRPCRASGCPQRTASTASPCCGWTCPSAPGADTLAAQPSRLAGITGCRAVPSPPPASCGPRGVRPASA